MSPTHAPSDVAGLRAALTGLAGDAYWARIAELAETPAFQELLRREFPSQAPRFGDRLQRRDFLRLMGGSLAVAGLGACTRQPDELIVPYAATPESTVPGRPRFYATAMPRGGGALGILVESHMGRPTKVEGNPDHPSSHGATDVYAQAATLGLYDPDRSRSLLRAGRIATWEAFLEELGGRMDGIEAEEGAGLRILVGEPHSPTLSAQLARLVERLPRARAHRWLPLHRDNAHRGARTAFGRDVSTRYRFDRAKVIVSLDADFLMEGSGCVRYARDFAANRRGRAATETMNRLYAVHAAATATSAAADHRLRMRPSEVEGFARALASEVGVAVEAPRIDDPTRRAFLAAVAEELKLEVGAGLIVPGEGQAPVVHALAHAINDRLGNAGRTVEYTEPIDATEGGMVESITALADDLRAGEVRLLVVLGGNPVYDAPTDLELGDALQACPLRVHLSLHEDETSRLCHWHVPAAHFLESWSDARGHDGTASIVQPLIAPLYGGRSAHELVAALDGRPEATAYELVREHWRARLAADSEQEFERLWTTALHDGVIAGTTAEPMAVVALAEPDFGPPPTPAGGLEVAFLADPSVYDGRFANNAWLQELPRPLSRLTWDNAALVSPATAARLDLSEGDVIEVTAGDRELNAPVWVLPGQADGTIGLHLGYGRRSAGGIGTGVGFDAYRLRTAPHQWRVAGVQVTRTGREHQLVSVQDHASMEGRDLVRVTTFDRFKAEGHDALARPAHAPAETSLYPEYAYDGYAWGMVIDLNACMGCNACMVACQAENNVPVVGKDQVALGREMHWIRIDRYYEEDQTLHQPVPCMHCEKAPCEVVCPVGATVHSSEGLNEMVYNRCVGTRYCSNNCPYKVRRFNFFRYADYETESLALGNNPDVTVRSRGVMEKCTYCVQRINQARIEAKKEDRLIRDGEVRTACQAVCPTQAIAFGDVNDESSRVGELRREPHHYALLAELGTQPRTTYLGRMTNPNPRLVDGGR